MNIRGATLDSTMNIADRQTCDRYAIGRRACRRAVLIVLLDDNAVLADVGERDILVAHG